MILFPGEMVDKLDCQLPYSLQFQRLEPGKEKLPVEETSSIGWIPIVGHSSRGQWGPQRLICRRVHPLKGAREQKTKVKNSESTAHRNPQCTGARRCCSVILKKRKWVNPIFLLFSVNSWPCPHDPRKLTAEQTCWNQISSLLSGLFGDSGGFIV